MNSCSYNLYLRFRLFTFFLLILALPAALSTPAKAQQNAAGSHDPLARSCSAKAFSRLTI